MCPGVAPSRHLCRLLEELRLHILMHKARNERRKAEQQMRLQEDARKFREACLLEELEEAERIAQDRLENPAQRTGSSLGRQKTVSWPP